MPNSFSKQVCAAPPSEGNPATNLAVEFFVLEDRMKMFRELCVNRDETIERIPARSTGSHERNLSALLWTIFRTHTEMSCLLKRCGHHFH